MAVDYKIALSKPQLSTGLIGRWQPAKKNNRNNTPLSLMVLIESHMLRSI